MKVIRVVNNVAPAGSVAIGRGSIWGNPFIIGPDGDRNTVIAKFNQYMYWRLSREINWLEPLRGKDLACYCSPNPCHGDAIIAFLSKIEEEDEAEAEFNLTSDLPAKCCEA